MRRLETKYPNGLLIRITDIHAEDGLATGQDHDLIGAVMLARGIRNSLIKGYYHIDGEIARESDKHPYKVGQYLGFFAAQFKELGAEDMIKELRNKEAGIEEYIL